MVALADGSWDPFNDAVLGIRWRRVADRFAELPVARAAVVFASVRHAGQHREIDRAPFIVHPIEVGELLLADGQPAEVVAAGLLHDVLEKTATTSAELRRRFGARIARLVETISDDPSIRDYEERKRALRDRVAHAASDTAAIFAADKIAKVRELGLLPPRRLDETQFCTKLAHYRASLEMLRRVAGEVRLVELLDVELNRLAARPATATRSYLEPVIGQGDRPRGGDRSWARWNEGLGQRYTLGVEEEVMLLEPSDWSLAQASDEVLARLSDELSAHTSPETHAAVVELATGVHPDVDGVVAELASLRNGLRRELGAMALTAAVAGTHPLTVREETEVSGAARYRALNDSMRVLARREPTMALHVHVGVPAPEDAVRLLNGLRSKIPVLLALSANSPFWQGSDSGFASARTVIFGAFPRTGLPRFFAGYDDYVDAIHALIASGAIRDPSFLWWDVRLQPALGTVEVRVMDALSRVREVAPLVALIQSLARLELEGDASSAVPGAEVLAENRFLAARDGMNARLIAPAARCLVPVREMLDALLAEVRPHALALGCVGALDRVKHLAAANGAERQRTFGARNGRLGELVASLADQFLAPD